MNTFKQKLVDSLEGENLFYFKYLLWGHYGLITSKQFIEKCLFLDMIIILGGLIFNIFIIHCFKETKLNGFQSFSSFILVLCLLAMMSCVAINVK